MFYDTDFIESLNLSINKLSSEKIIAKPLQNIKI